MDQTNRAAGSTLGIALRQLAVDVMTRGVGTPLPTNAQYLSDHQLGAGTIQRALGLLADRGALSTTSHGHRGRRVNEFDIGRLWQLGALAPVRVIMPVDGPDEIERLKGALAQGLTNLGLPHTMQHLRGGRVRLASVRAGKHDIAVTSAGAVEEGTSESPPHDLTRMLPTGSYYSRASLVTVHLASVDPDGADLLRVAIDHESLDHVALTQAEFPSGEGHASYVEIPFTSVPAAVLRDEVDVGIWHRQETIIPLELAGLSATPLKRPQAERTWERLSSAVLSGWAERPELAAVLSALELDLWSGEPTGSR